MMTYNYNQRYQHNLHLVELHSSWCLTLFAFKGPFCELNIGNNKKSVYIHIEYSSKCNTQITTLSKFHSKQKIIVSNYILDQIIGSKGKVNIF